MSSLGVGICALNEEDALPRLLSRLLQGADAADRPDHVVVADGGSEDATAEIARRVGATVIDAPRGRGRQLAEAGAALIDRGADVLLFLHADCVPRTGSIARVRAAFDADEELAVAGLRQSIEGERRAFRWIERAANARARRGMLYGDSGLVVRRAAYEAVGGYPAVPLFEDVAISKSLRAHHRVRLLEDATLAISARRWRDEGVVRGTIRNWILRGLYEMRVSPGALVRLYRPFRRR